MIFIGNQFFQLPPASVSFRQLPPAFAGKIQFCVFLIFLSLGGKLDFMLVGVASEDGHLKKEREK